MARRSNEEYTAVAEMVPEEQGEYAPPQQESEQPPMDTTQENESSATMESLRAELQSLEKRMAEIKAEMQRIANVQYANSAKVTQMDHIASSKAVTEALRKEGKLHGGNRRRK